MLPITHTVLLNLNVVSEPFQARLLHDGSNWCHKANQTIVQERIQVIDKVTKHVENTVFVYGNMDYMPRTNGHCQKPPPLWLLPLLHGHRKNGKSNLNQAMSICWRYIRPRYDQPVSTKPSCIGGGEVDQLHKRPQQGFSFPGSIYVSSGVRALTASFKELFKKVYSLKLAYTLNDQPILHKVFLPSLCWRRGLLPPVAAPAAAATDSGYNTDNTDWQSQNWTKIVWKGKQDFFICEMCQSLGKFSLISFCRILWVSIYLVVSRKGMGWK